MRDYAKAHFLRTGWHLLPTAAHHRSWQLQYRCSAAAVAPSHRHSADPGLAGRPLLPSCWQCHDSAACRKRMQCPVLRESQCSHPPNGASCPACREVVTSHKRGIKRLLPRRHYNQCSARSHKAVKHAAHTSWQSCFALLLKAASWQLATLRCDRFLHCHSSNTGV